MQAGAGSGKTTVLTGRLESLLEEPDADLSRVVAITFTEKAAAELKDRLRALCDARFLAASDKTERARWERHRRHLEAAHLGTIHGFCSRLLRVHALRLGLDPYFTVLDEAAQTLFVRERVHDHALQRLRDGDAPLTTLVAALSLGTAVGTLVSLVHNRAKLALDRPPTSAAEVAARWQEVLAAQAARSVALLHADPTVAEAARSLRETQPLDPDDPLARSREAALALLDQALDQATPPLQAVAAWAEIRQVSLSTRGTKKASWVDKGAATVREAIKTLHTCADTLKHLFSPGESAEADAAELTACLLTALPGVLAAYDAGKRERSALDFDDLLLLARDLLRDHPDLRALEQQRFEHLLVDEFQDTDPVQRELIWYLAEDGARAKRLGEVRLRPGRLFVVGDAKQSIYAFRGADVTVYDDTRREFEADPAGGLVPLTANFRSRPRLVAFLNEFFTRREVMGGDHPDRRSFEAYYERLAATRPDANAGPDVTFILASDTGRTLPELRVTVAHRLARYLADAVRDGTLRVCDQDAEGHERARPAGFGDILFLLPTMSSVHLYEQALRAHGVPYYLVAGKGFYYRPEVLDVITVLRVLDDPHDELALARLLRSPCGGVSDEGLYWLARERGLARGLRQLGAAPEGPLANLSADDLACARRAAALLADLREVRDRLPLSELVARALDATLLPALVAAQFDGQRAYVNLQKLIEVAGAYEATESPSLARFIRYVETLRTQEVREGEAPAAEERGDVVTLMTVHKAKGLEAPVVVAADLAQGWAPHSRETVVLDPLAGPVAKGRTDEGVLRFPPMGQAAFRDLRDREEAEARRLLYVALTRARDRLLISTPLALDAASAPAAHRSGTHVQALFAAFGDALLREGTIRGEGEHGPWEAEVLHAVESPSDVLSLRRRPSLLDTHAREIESAQPLSVPAAPSPTAEDLVRAAARLEPDLASRLRFTVTELSAYLHCPRCYELRYVRGLAPHSPPASPVACGRLRPTERGTVVHRALQRLGRGPVEGLRALVEAALRESGLAGHDRDEVESIVELLQAFTESETWRLVSRAAELRTEASVVAPFEGGLLEGQIDALLTDREGGLHVLDYKTGRAQEEGTRGQHLFQVGAYAAALERCRGCLPASVAVHYLAGNERIEADPAEAASPARRQAEEAMCGIRDARFPRSPSCDPQTCAYAWVCGTEEWAIHRAARATPP